METTIQPVPIEKMPAATKGACVSFQRQLDQVVLQGHATEQELRSTFGILEQWAHRQLELLDERAQGGATATA
jgi:hypothetical protein